MDSKPVRIAVPDGAAGLVHFGGSLDLLGAEVILDLDWKTLSADDNFDLCVVAGECLRNQSMAAIECVKRGIPTLLVMDGALEWRNTWQHYSDPETALSAPLLQPVLSHKVACMGQRQVEWISDFGNHGRCESVGLPRLDELASASSKNTLRVKKNRLLVASANTPGYDQMQWSVVEQSYRDLFNYLMPQYDVVWRLCPRLDEVLGVRSDLSVSVADTIQSADAVITGPSTLIIEAMLARVPVALLDYFDTPNYFAPGWQIRCKGHLGSVIPGLFDPEPERLFHQNIELQRQLRMDGPATPRLADLMRDMIRIGRDARSGGGQLAFPAQMVPPSEPIDQDSGSRDSRFLGIGQFQQRDERLLQIEIAHLRAELAKDTRSSTCFGKVRRLLGL